MGNRVMQGLVLRGIKYGLKMLRNYMSTKDFKVTVDQVLDRIEDHYTEGTVKDQVIEAITAELREYFDIEDNDSTK